MPTEHRRVNAEHLDGSTGRQEQPIGEAKNGRLPGARGTNKRDTFSCNDGEIEVAYRWRGCGSVTNRDTAECEDSHLDQLNLRVDLADGPADVFYVVVVAVLGVDEGLCTEELKDRSMFSIARIEILQRFENVVYD
jgi:hypothetical protein